MKRWDWRLAVAPVGGGIAAVCFFLPWGKFSFLLLHKSAAGHTIGGSAWLIFLVAAIVLLAGLALPRMGRFAAARWSVLGGAILGLVFFGIKAGEMSRGMWTPFGRLQPQDVGVKPGPGAMGMLAGLVLAVAGAVIMPGNWSLNLPLRARFAARTRSGRQTERATCPEEHD